MFGDLNAITDFSEKNPPKGKFFVVADSQTDGSFIIHHFLSLYLKGELPVCFLALAQSFSHYNTIAQKLGFNLINARENGNLVFIDGLNLISEALCSENGEPCKNEDNPFWQIRESSFTLQLLYKKIKEFVDKKHGCLLLIDNVSILLNLGVSVHNVSYFMQYCYTLMCSPTDEQDGGCLVSLVHTDHDVEDEDALLLWKQLCYWAQIEFHVEGLSSGYCKDIHGQLTITWRNNGVVPQKHIQKMFQYKIQDKNVRFFAPGTSKAVL